MNINTANTQEEKRFDWEEARKQISDAKSVSAKESAMQPDDDPRIKRIWKERAAQLAQTPTRQDQGEQIDLVLIKLGRELYALDAQHVLEIKLAEQITPVPRVPDWVSGVVNLRGRILSVLDLRRFFNLTDTEQKQPQNKQGEERGNEAPKLVIVEASDMEVALLTDSVLSVEKMPTAQIQESIDVIRGIGPEYVRGIAERRGKEITSNLEKLVVLLDLPKLLADERLIIDEEVI